MKKISKHKKIYTIYSYDDVDGAIAAAICQNHLNLKYIAARATRLRLIRRTTQAKRHKPSNQTKTLIEFDIKFVPRPVQKTQCASGYLRQHYKEFGISKKLINRYDNFIDIAEIIQGNVTLPLMSACRGSTSESTCDFSSNAVKLNILFHTKHPLISKNAMYKKFVHQITKNPCIEDFFDSDILFSSIIEYEKQILEIK